MSSVNGATEQANRWEDREPIFRDIPFEQSEWEGLYTVLKQVNQLKAELVRVQYEAARKAYQNYLQAREQERDAYAVRRREDEAYNREVYARRQEVLGQIEAIRQKWRDEIDRLRQALDAALHKAYHCAGKAGLNLRGEPILGIGLELHEDASEAIAVSGNASPNGQSETPVVGSVDPTSISVEGVPPSEPQESARSPLIRLRLPFPRSQPPTSNVPPAMPVGSSLGGSVSSASIAAPTLSPNTPPPSPSMPPTGQSSTRTSSPETPVAPLPPAPVVQPTVSSPTSSPLGTGNPELSNPEPSAPANQRETGSSEPHAPQKSATSVALAGGSGEVQPAQDEADEELEPIAPLTYEEAAHAQRLPTQQALVIPCWLHWAAPMVIGLMLGQLFLVASGRPLAAWAELPFWIASLGGMLIVLLWYRAVWGVSRAVSELYYLFDWSAVKARRAARLGGLAIIALLILPTGALLAALILLESIWTSEIQLLATVMLIALIPLLGVALVGGYFQGRGQVVRNALESDVVAAKREQAVEERRMREQARLEREQERIQQAQLRLAQEQERTEQARLRLEQMPYETAREREQLRLQQEQERTQQERLRLQQEQERTRREQITTERARYEQEPAQTLRTFPKPLNTFAESEPSASTDVAPVNPATGEPSAFTDRTLIPVAQQLPNAPAPNTGFPFAPLHDASHDGRETVAPPDSDPYAPDEPTLPHADEVAGTAIPYTTEIMSNTLDIQRLRQEAFVAIAEARGADAAYQRALQAMQQELEPYEQMLPELQPRPIYDFLPPHAEERLQTLYQQWLHTYRAFLDYVAEAARECKDSEQIQQRIAEFRQALLN